MGETMSCYYKIEEFIFFLKIFGKMIIKKLHNVGIPLSLAFLTILVAGSIPKIEFTLVL